MQREHQKIALEIARKVRSGELTRHTGAQLLNAKTGIPATSTGIVIAVYLNMSKGSVFKRTLSASDMDYVIGRIAEEEGIVQLQKALTALRLHIEYRESGNLNPRQHKAILTKYENWLKTEKIDAIRPVHFADLDGEFNREVEISRELSKEMRRKRLATAPTRAKKVARLVYIFERNPDVVAEVLERADGYCEGCKEKAPFTRRSDGTAYLEVHHRQPLAKGGDDTVENAIALCPNCHRHSHFG